MATTKGRQKVERGPTSDYVADNVARLRKRLSLSQQDLSTRLAELGRPMLPSAISKIEGRERGVDVDDLMALALALGVTPNRLLLGGEAGNEEVRLTAERSAEGWAAWQWADGSAPLPTRSADDGYNTADEHEQYVMHARPAESRRYAQHPLGRAVTDVQHSAFRVIHFLLTGDGKAVNHALRRARHAARRLSSELDAVEEEVADRG